MGALLRMGIISLSLLGLDSCAAPMATPADTFVQKDVLIFNHTGGFRHDSIEDGTQALTALAEGKGYRVMTSADPLIFNENTLANIDVVVLLNTTSNPDGSGEWFTGQARDAFQRFVQSGGGVLGVHAATDSHYSWPWYGKLMGAYFFDHPELLTVGTLKIVRRAHPATQALPQSASLRDEWYYFKDFNPEVDLLVTLDPASIGERDVNPNPISWAHEFDGGRMFYTALGHRSAIYQEPYFLKHLSGAFDWLTQEAQ